MMGGGFGGCTINLIKEGVLEPLIATLQKNYEAAMGLPLTYYVASIEDGTKIVNG
jgi:galactokinase